MHGTHNFKIMEDFIIPRVTLVDTPSTADHVHTYT